MPGNLLQVVGQTALDADEIASRSELLHAAVLGKSRYIDAPNFTRIHPEDLELLFREYDDRFFQGRIRKTLGDTPLRFRLSRRMTSAGGKTTCYVDRPSGHRWYEITASTAILFGCFTDEDHRPIAASGIVCRDRLGALQRVMEHEIVHLIEKLLWDESSCSKPRFRSITLRLFGHTENRHQLITPQEAARVQYGIRPGVTVWFRHGGVEHRGIVNRIRKRATVLVEDRRGQRYSDGKRYSKFYVPVPELQAKE